MSYHNFRQELSIMMLRKILTSEGITKTKNYQQIKIEANLSNVYTNNNNILTFNSL